ncbi:MAG: hypothetical protein ACRD6W_06705, partial [Nitrososphaerales archaeon]
LLTAQRVLVAVVSAGLPVPRIAPTPGGGVESAWSSKEFEVGVTFEPGQPIFAQSVNVESGDTTEQDFTPQRPLGLEEFLGKFL